MQYRFGDYELSTVRFELSRAGQPVLLEPQVLHLIILLLERRDRLVVKDEIMAEVWGNRIVTWSLSLAKPLSALPPMSHWTHWPA